MERKLPETSHEANKEMTYDLKLNHKKQIVLALKILKKATFEEIANHLNWDDKNRVARRLLELERDQLIYKPGEKRLTKYGRNAYVYSLISNG